MLATDDAIAAAQKTLWRALRVVAEPGGAAAFSAILSAHIGLKPANGLPSPSAAATPQR